MSEAIKEKKLEVFLTEYKVLKKHLNLIQDRQTKLYTIIILALIIIYGIVFINPIGLDLILIIPFLTLAIGLIFQNEKYSIWVIGKYLEKIEKKIGEIIGSKIHNEEDLKDNNDEKSKRYMIGKNIEWSGFQTYYRTLKEFTYEGKSKGILYDILPNLLIFIIIPMSISIFYCYLIITNVLKNANNLPIEIYVILIVVYFIIIIESPFITWGLDKSDKILNKKLT